MLREMMTVKEAFEVFEDAMLSDANIRNRPPNRESFFRISLKQGHQDWLMVISRAIELIDCTPFDLTTYDSNGTTFDYLSSHASPMMTALGAGWYNKERKCVPSSFTLTPVSLAGWFMGDGTSSLHIGGKTVYPTVHIIATAFTIDELELLALQVARITGYEPTLYVSKRIYRGSKQPRKELVYSNVESSNAFYDMIKEYVTPSFKYKLKYGARGGLPLLSY